MTSDRSNFSRWISYPCFGAMARGHSYTNDLSLQGRATPTEAEVLIPVSSTWRQDALALSKYLSQLNKHSFISKYINGLYLWEVKDSLMSDRMKYGSHIEARGKEVSGSAKHQLYLQLFMNLSAPTDVLLSVCFLLRNFVMDDSKNRDDGVKIEDLSPEESFRFLIYKSIYNTTYVKSNTPAGRIYFFGKCGGSIHECTALDLSNILSYTGDSVVGGHQGIFNQQLSTISLPDGFVEFEIPLGVGYINDSYLTVYNALSKSGFNKLYSMGDMYHRYEEYNSSHPSVIVDRELGKSRTRQVHMTEGFMPSSWVYNSEFEAKPNKCINPLSFPVFDKIFLSGELENGGTSYVGDFYSNAVGLAK